MRGSWKIGLQIAGILGVIRMDQAAAAHDGIALAVEFFLAFGCLYFAYIGDGE